MTNFRAALISGTAIPAGLLIGWSQLGTAPRLAPITPALAQNPCAGRANPCAARRNPCAPRANPCAARNPCAAGANPCNPCAAGAAFSARCVVPRLVQAAAANPCAAKRNPCAAAANPCAAKANPCAAKANPCAAKANPCAAKANPCNPCNPCGGADAVELQDREAVAAYDCLLKEMQAAYAKSGHPTAKSFIKWRRYSTQSYQSATHGARFVQNYGNDQARAYGAFERAGRLPVGAQIAKDSFVVSPDGKLGVGPLFLMEKMNAGFDADGGDWKYTMIMPDGTIFGETKGRNAAEMAFCTQCHASAADNDHLMFLPAEYRVKR